MNIVVTYCTYVVNCRGETLLLWLTGIARMCGGIELKIFGGSLSTLRRTYLIPPVFAPSGLIVVCLCSPSPPSFRPSWLSRAWQIVTIPNPHWNQSRTKKMYYSPNLSHCKPGSYMLNSGIANLRGTKKPFLEKIPRQGKLSEKDSSEKE